MKKNIIMVFVMMIAMISGAHAEVQKGGGFGKYDFLPSTGSEFCKKAPKELNCCSGTWEDPKTEMVWTGGMWRVGINAEECQYAMYDAFLAETEGLK